MAIAYSYLGRERRFTMKRTLLFALLIAGLFVCCPFSFAWCQTENRTLDIELEKFTAPSSLVEMVDFSVYIEDVGSDERVYVSAVFENGTVFELYFVKGNVIYKDSTGTPVHTEDLYFKGETEFEYREGSFTSSVPPNTMGIGKFQVAILEETTEEVVKTKAKTAVIALSWQQNYPSVKGDLDEDGDVDFDDFFILADNFGKSAIPDE